MLLGITWSSDNSESGNSFALMACLYEDKETAKKIFGEIERVDYSAWGGSSYYQKYSKWIQDEDSAEK